MGYADLIVGLAAVIAGLASLARRGAPLAPPWRLWLAVWGHAASLAAGVTLMVVEPVLVIETPVLLVAAFSLGELAVSVLDLRGWAGRRTPDWLA